MKNVAFVSIDKDAFNLVNLLPDLNFIGYFDIVDHGAICNLQYLGPDENANTYFKQYPDLFCIMLIDIPSVKLRLVEHYGADNFLTLVSPKADISEWSHVGTGTFIQNKVTVSTNVHIGKFVKINMNASLHHDTQIGDYCTVAPGATLLGNCTVGKGTYIGSGSIILPRVTIGENVIIGAGAVVTKDIPDNQTIVGIPGTPLKNVRKFSLKNLLSNFKQGS